jgi:hypothetical protein
MLGGVALLGTARRLATPIGALVATAAYLFQPYGIVASESMQPDLLMMMLALVSLYAICRYDEQPTYRAALLAGACAGLAGLVKPVCLPVLAGFHLALRLRNQPALALLRDPREMTVAGCVATPVSAHYVRNILAGNRLKSLSGMTFRPHLLLTKKFWLAWAKKLSHVMGGAWVSLAVPIGIACARGRMRWALIGLTGGYFVTGLIFNFHFSTHDHYQLTFFPAFALALGAIADAVAAYVMPRDIRYRLGALGLVVLMAGTATHRYVTESLPLLRGDSSLQATYKRIGKVVHHSENVMFATNDAYGSTLEYYGWLSGWFYEMRKVSPGLVDAPEDNLAALKEHLEDFQPEYFVVTPPELLDQQPGTHKHLVEIALAEQRTRSYVVFDLVGRERDNPTWTQPRRARPTARDRARERDEDRDRDRRARERRRAKAERRELEGMANGE